MNKKHITSLKSAFVSAVLVALIVVFSDIIAVGNIFELNWRDLANAGIMSLFTGLVSILKSLLTDNSGKVLGMKIK